MALPTSPMRTSRTRAEAEGLALRQIGSIAIGSYLPGDHWTAAPRRETSPVPTAAIQCLGAEQAKHMFLVWLESLTWRMSKPARCFSLGPVDQKTLRPHRFPLCSSVAALARLLPRFALPWTISASNDSPKTRLSLLFHIMCRLLWS